jgi:nicotinamidase-related amidase
MQRAIDAPYWAEAEPRNHPEAESRIAQLLEAWRSTGRPVIHIRHDSRDPGSAYRPGQPGHEFKTEAAPLQDETVVAKQTNSAFIGTSLQTLLESARIRTVLVAGAITNNSVEATVRTAGNLGFETFLIEDACFTFARRDYDGILRTAQEVHAMSLANLDGEYCKVVTTAAVFSAAALSDAALP